MVCSFASFLGVAAYDTFVDKPNVQQLIDLEIVISKQSETIESQAIAITKLEAEREEIFKTALEVAGENYALHKVIDDMTVSMRQMLEYIKTLEDRDA